MSIERRLLERVMYRIPSAVISEHDLDLVDDIKELLAQPEQTEQEPVAWITEWVQRYRHNDTPIMDRAVSFTKGGAPAVPNPNYMPLYTSPQKREPLSDEDICEILIKKEWKGFVDLVRIIEKTHGIGGGE